MGPFRGAIAGLALVVAGCGGAPSPAEDAASMAASPMGAEPTMWAKSTAGTGTTWSSGVVTLPEGGCVVGLCHSGQVVLAEGEPNQQGFDSADQDACLVRFGPEGELVWATHVHGPGNAQLAGVARLADASLVAAGFFEGTAVFGAEGDEQVSLDAAVDGVSAFVARYAADGRLLGAEAFGADAEWFEAFATTALPDGSFAVIGMFTGTFEGMPVAGGLAFGTTSTAFVRVHEPDGRVRWTRTIPARAGGAVSGWSVAATSESGAVVAGIFEGEAVFGAGETRETSLVSRGGTDVFVARFGPGGDLAWARSIGGAGAEDTWAVATAPDDSVRVTATYEGTVVLDGGAAAAGLLEAEAGSAGDLLLASYSPEGDLAWARPLLTGATCNARSVRVRLDGATYVGGMFSGTALLDGDGAAQETVSSSKTEDTDAWLGLYDADGERLWIGSCGGSADASAVGIDVSRSGNVFVTGCFTGETTLSDPHGCRPTLRSDSPLAAFVVQGME